MKTKSIIIFMGISGTAEKLEINKFYKFFDEIHKVGPSPGRQNATAISPPPPRTSVDSHPKGPTRGSGAHNPKTP